MTTIAWDGKTLAGDTLVSGGGDYQATKIYAIKDAILGDILYGGSGHLECAIKVLNWISAGMNPDDKPEFKDSLTFEGIMIIGGKPYNLEDGLVLLPRKTVKAAIGSGAAFALAAMQCGRNAKQAVKVASIFDSCTGTDIETLTLPS